ncbi:TetR/AcrR family transcriptional regulator [Candidatus Lucifugimonas marina]|jgi:AcrR family transcriptional regulator|uniref:TetR family transcriptional regulator n=1 Tax=Candidatus Lucifugimonas marina TaxID=3038979 RepID=A0AAJ5ZDF1_9CHLR|nr:TetR family transcriptional regulator [SAR202 cluster bacterium JH702]MDG0869460.1 TetR family transcriptional regulator [SAR202 cluster bacterium JH639]WFG34200.1 TetR family transcriptional regulator [SAR202 cluster bacterium JH545]WFG38129.1 TetR family transcriptional regulator [SAR202 cluster bacterium JH1073]
MAVAERTQSEAQRRKQILDAARGVFGEKGYESATVSDIVKRAGVAQGTFYLYFDSKKSVVVELARQPMDEMATRLQGILSGDESFAEILQKFVQLGFEVGGDNPDLCGLMHLSDSGEEDLEDIEGHARVSEMAVAMFQGFIDAGQAVHIDAKVAAEMFKVIMSGSMRLAFATEPPVASVEEIRKATEIVVLGAFVKRPT